MKIIRQNMFETNSSSTHSLTLKIKDKDERFLTEEELKNIKPDNGDDIVREIRSYYGKATIVYSFFMKTLCQDLLQIINDMDGIEHATIKEKLKLEDLGNIDINEYYNHIIFYALYYIHLDYVYDFGTLEKWEKDYYNDIRKRYDEIIEKAVNFKLALIERDKSGKLPLKLKEIEANYDYGRGNVDEGIMDFFSREAIDDSLERCYGEITINTFLDILGIKGDNSLLELAKRLEDPNIYFRATEGFMARDDIPRIL